MRRWRRTNIASAYIVLVLFVGSSWTQTTDDTATADFTDDTATDVLDGATASGTIYGEITSAVSIVDTDTSVTNADDYNEDTTAIMETDNPSTSEQNVEDATGTVDTSEDTEATASELPNNNETVSDTAMDTTTVISVTENSDVTESDNTTIEGDDDSFTTASSFDDYEGTTVENTITLVSTNGDIATTAFDSEGTEQNTSTMSSNTDADIEPTNAMSTEADNFGGTTEEDISHTTVPTDDDVPTTTSAADSDNTDQVTSTMSSTTDVVMEPTNETSTDADYFEGNTDENTATPDTTVSTDGDVPATSTADSDNTEQGTSTMSSTTDAVIEPTNKTAMDADENTATPETTVPTDGDIPTTASAADQDTSTMSSTTSADIESTNAMSTTVESDVTIDNEVVTMSTTEGYNQTVATESSQTRSSTDSTRDIETTAASATVMITEGNQPETMTTTESGNQTRSVTTPTDDIKTTAASTTAMVTRGNQYETMASTGMDNQTKSVTDPTDDIETTSATTTIMVTSGNQSGTMSSTGMDNQTRSVTNPTDDIETTTAFTTVMITKSTGDVISTTDVSTATVVTPTTVLATTRITDLTGQSTSTIRASTPDTTGTIATTSDITTIPTSTSERTTITASSSDTTTSTASTRDTATTTASTRDTATTTTITTSTPDTTTQSTAPQQNDICALDNIQVREADTIASPNYPQNYDGNRNCMIQLQNPDSCGRISITLERLRTEFPYDTLQIDGIEGVEGGEARLSGDVSRTTYYSTSDTVTIRFDSSANSLGEQGFQLTYEPVTNECECSNPCGNHSTCSYSAGKTTCECDCGYSHVDMQDGSKPGSNCDLDECTIGTDDCDQICTNKVDDYSCSCDEGFTWNSDERKCEADFPYERSTCKGGIAYYDASQREQCKCPKYYVANGFTCVLAGSDLGASICSDGLRLLPFAPGFECTCPAGYGLSSVSNNKCCVKEQCTDDTCNGRGECAESDAGPVCTCDNTSKGDRCQDLVTCADAECKFGECVDLEQGGFECRCGKGYESSGAACVDIDECETNCMGKDKSCTNYEPGYTCRCADGYEPPRNHPNDGSICHEIVMLDITGDEETVRTSSNFHRGVFAVPITYGTNVFSRFILQQDGVIILEKGPTRHRVYMPFIAYTDLPTIRRRFTDLAVVCAFLGDYYWYYDRDTYVAQYDFQSDGGRTKLMTITDIVKNSNNSVQSDFNAIGALVVTWTNRQARVARGRDNFDKSDNFQMILATDGNVTYSVFNFRVGYMDARHYQRKDSPPLMGWTDTKTAYTETSMQPRERPDLSSNVGKNGRWVFKIGAASRVWNPQCLAWNAEASEPESSNICPPTFRNAWRSGYRYLPSTPVWIITFRFFWGRFYLSFRYYHPLSDFDAIDELREFAPSHCLQRSRNAAYDGSNSICCYNNRRKRRLIEADYSPDNLLVAGQVVQSPVYGSDHSQAQRYLENDVRPRSWCCDDLNEETCSLYRNKRPAVTSAGYRFRGRFCQSRGEPLLSTLDGNDYLFSGLGEYILGMGNNTMMQGRLSQSTDVNGTLIEGSVLTAFAVGGNDTGVESLGFYLGGINGTSDLLNMTITLGRQRLDDESIELLTNGTGIDLGDLQIELANSSVQVSTKNSYTITITPTAKLLTVIISSQPDTFGDLKGLYGLYDGDSANDFEMRNTTVLELDALRFNPYPSPADARQTRMNKYFTNETILEEKVFDFGQSWLVEESETLFTYGVGQSWSTMRNVTFRPKSLPDLLEEASEEQLEETDELCLKSGLYDLSCLRTFLITGDKSAAQNTLDAGDALEETKTDLNNVPPEWEVNITEILLEVEKEFVLQLKANDTGELTYGIEGTILDLNHTFNTTTGEFTFTPTDLTVFNVTFTVTDSGDLQRTLTPTVKICTCEHGGNCSYDSDPVNTTDRFQVHGCNCPEAYDGDFCSDNYDECQFNPCDGGTCTDVEAPGTGYNCTIECAEGEELIDNKCYLIDLCNETKPCEQICETSRGGYNCSCEAGYAVSAANDSRCEDVDECLTNTSCPAVNTFCENSVGNFSCVCDDGYTGNVSTGCVDIDECDTTAPCNATTQTCLNSPGSFSCSCKTGYTLDNGTCVNVNECDNTELCDNLTQTCSDTEGSYKCDCRDGYSAANGSSTCEDIDECAENRHNCPSGASCSNEVGSFLCICGSGYNYNSTANECVDIDECADNNGACNFTCDNSDGSFKCSCDVGFRIASNGFGCVDIDECSDPAKCQQDCKNTPGNYSCSCYEGFVGDGDACQANATCTNTTLIDCVNADCYLNSTNEPNCLCKSGFEAVNGTHCEDIKECDTGDACGADASCTEESPGYACSCNSRYVDVAGSDSKTVVTCKRVVAPTVVEPTGSNLGDDFAYITWNNGDLVDNTRVTLEQIGDAGTVNGAVVNETVGSTVAVYNFTSLMFRTQYRVSLYAIYKNVSGDQEQFNFTTTFTMYPPEISRGNVTTSTIQLLLNRPTNGPCPDISLSYRAEGSNVTGSDSTKNDSAMLSALSPGITYTISAKCVDGADVSEESAEISIQTVAVTTTTEAPTTSMYQETTTEGTNATTALNGTQTEATTVASNDTQAETTTQDLNGTQTEATTLASNATQINATATTPASNETKTKTTTQVLNATQTEPTTQALNGTQTEATTPASNETKTEATTRALNGTLTEATTQVLNATKTDGTTTTLAPNATASSTTTLASNDTGTHAATTAPAGTVQTETTTESQASSTTSTTEAATVAPSTTVQLETTTSSVTTAVATTTPEPAVAPAVVRVSVQVTFELPCNPSLIADTSSAYYQNYLEIFRNVTFALFKYIGRPVNTLARVTLTCGSVVASGEAELPANTTASSNETQAELQDAIANSSVPEIAENNVTSAEVTDVDECANSTDNNCDANADCADQDPGFQCSCKAGYWDRDPDNAGTKCEVQCEYGGSPYCMNSGNCTNGTGTEAPSCVCSSDYTGDRCETQVPTTAITTAAEETTSDPDALTPTAAATDALTVTTTVPAGTDSDVGTPTSTEDPATATDALTATEAESTTADTDSSTSTVPDSTGVVTDALTATEAESTAAVTDSSTSTVADSTDAATDALTATEAESTAAVTDSSTSTVADSTDAATDALTATEAESTAAVTDSSTSTVPDPTDAATDALTATEAESTAAVTDSSTVPDSTDAATDALTAAGTDSTTADTDASTPTASDQTATDTDGSTPTASDPTATDADTLTPAVSDPTATEADTTAASVMDETTAGATSDGTDVSTSASSVGATSASDEATTSTIAATTTTLEPSTTTQTTTSSETTTTPGTTTTPIATTTQDTTTTPETTTSSIATTTQETTTTPESTTITQTSTTTPQPGTNPEPTTSQGPTVPSESTSISQTVSTKSASTTESAAETQTTTTTLAPTTTPPRTDVTQMNFSMTLNQTCDQEVTNAGSQAYLQALAIFRQVVLALGNYTQVPVFGIAEMSFRCGSIIGSGVLQLPRNVTDNSTQVAEKFSNAIASGEVPEVRTQSVQGLNVSDVNECSNGRNNCDESADCTDTDPGFTCQCLSGFRDLVPSDPGTSCEDQCFLSGADYCTNGATCVRQQGSQNPTCQCTDFYQGARCADRNGGAIAGLTIGLLALAALIVAAVAIVIHLRRKRKSHNFAAADVPAEARTRYDDVSTGSTRGRLDDVLQ